MASGNMVLKDNNDPEDVVVAVTVVDTVVVGVVFHDDSGTVGTRSETGTHG